MDEKRAGLVDQEAAYNEERERLFNSQVFLASSSQKRKDALVILGFKPNNIHTFSTPDETEIEAFEKYEANFKPSEEDERRGKHAEAVARAKLGYCLDHKQIPSEAMAAAFDTLPSMFIYNPKMAEPGERTFIYEALRKPENNESAKKIVKETLLSLLRLRLQFEYTTYRTLVNDENTMVLDRSPLALDIITVQTGGAVRFPNRPEIVSFQDEIQVRFKKIVELVEQLDWTSIEVGYDKPETFTKMRSENFLNDTLPKGRLKNGQSVEEAINKLVEELDKEGLINPKISGGLDYSNVKLRNILQAEEKLSFITGFDKKITYRGFPVEGFKEVIAEEIRRNMRKE